MSFSNRQKLNAIKIVFGGTNIDDHDPTRFTWCLPAASATFVPGKANIRSNYITFATGDSTEIFGHAGRKPCSPCRRCGVQGSLLESRSGIYPWISSGSSHLVRSAKNTANVLGTMICANHVPGPKRIYLGVLKVPYSLGDQSITVALCLSH